MWTLSPISKIGLAVKSNTASATVKRYIRRVTEWGLLNDAYRNVLFWLLDFLLTVGELKGLFKLLYGSLDSTASHALVLSLWQDSYMYHMQCPIRHWMFPAIDFSDSHMTRQFPAKSNKFCHHRTPKRRNWLPENDSL